RLFNEKDVARIPADDQEKMQPPTVVLINESFANRKYPGQDPIGRRVCVRCDPGAEKWANIVGVVGDVRQVSLELGNPDAVYLPNTQWYWADNAMSLVTRSRCDAAS